MEATTSLSTRLFANTALCYAAALSAIVIALLIRSALSPLLGTSVPYLTLFPAVAFCAWYCGVGPSLAGVVVGVLAARYWFIPPVRSFSLPELTHSIGVLGFLLASGVIVMMGEARRHQNQQLQRAQGALEDRVRERTAELDGANQSLRELTARLLQLRDEERRRFARELHDSVGQVLAALSINVSNARSDIERLTKTADALRQSESLIQDVSKEVRTISHLLHPPLLDEAGLFSALRWYVDGFSERSKIKVDLNLPKEFGRLFPELETAVFRFVQECLTNIHRHSGSSTATIRIAHSDTAVHVEVEDEGKGIPHEKLLEMNSGSLAGVGIRGMRERIRQLGGTLEIDSGVKGTRIRAGFPIVAGSSTAAA